MPPHKQQDKLLTSYINVVDHNFKNNDDKFTSYDYCISYTLLSLMLVLLTPLATWLDMGCWINRTFGQHSDSAIGLAILLAIIGPALLAKTREKMS